MYKNIYLLERFSDEHQSVISNIAKQCVNGLWELPENFSMLVDFLVKHDLQDDTVDDVIQMKSQMSWLSIGFPQIFDQGLDFVLDGVFDLLFAEAEVFRSVQKVATMFFPCWTFFLGNAYG